MEELEIKGQKYISSKRAAEITGYASDYVGQLARAKKVQATRVGRSWYVSEYDILKHAGKLEEDTLPEEAPVRSLTAYSETSNTRSLHSLRSLQGEQKKFKTWSAISYHAEDKELYPVSEKNEPVHVVTIKKAEVPVIHPNTTPVTFDGLLARDPEPVLSPLPQRKEAQVAYSAAPRAKNPSLLPTFFVFSAITTAAVALIFSVSGIGISNDWAVSVNSQVGSSYSADFSLILGYLKDFMFLGLDQAFLFIKTLFAYLNEYFIAGFDFILHILNLG